MGRLEELEGVMAQKQREVHTHLHTTTGQA